MRRRALSAAVAMVCCHAWAIAAVVDSSDHGFTIRTTIRIRAAPDEVYRRLVRNVGEWWSSAHTFSGNSRNLSIEEKPMGCFCEKLPNGGGVRHLEVVFVAPGKKLVFAGGLGPLQPIAATGSLQIELSPAGDGTNLHLTYSVAGYLPAGMSSWAAPVDSVLSEQFTRLKHYTESGDPQPR